LKDELTVLREARSLIEQGWCQRRGKQLLPNGATAYCPIYALREAAMDETAYIRGLVRLSQNLPRVNHKGKVVFDQILSKWNDQPERSQQEVLDLFDRTIAELAGVA